MNPIKISGIAASLCFVLASCDGVDFGGSGAKSPGNDGDETTPDRPDDSETDQASKETATGSETEPDANTETKTGTETKTVTATDTGTNTDPGVSDKCGTFPAIEKGGVTSMRVLSSGSIIVGGYGRTDGTPYDDASVWRYTADAKLDTSYASGGKFSLHGGSNNVESVKSLETLSDGSVIGVFGTTGLKLDPQGVNDTAFLLPSGMQALVHLKDDVFAGVSNDRVFKFDSAGTVDATFGTAGYTLIPDVDFVQAIAPAVTDKILVLTSHAVGLAPNAYHWALYELKLTRLNADGSVDTTFGSSGSVIFADEFPHDVDGGFTAFKVLSNGQIVVSSYTADYTKASPRTDGIVYLLEANGTLVNTFGSGGRFTADFAANANYDQLNAVDEFPDGSLLFAGWMMTGNQEHMLTHLDRTAQPVAPIGSKKVPLSKTSTDFLNAVKITSATSLWAVGGACAYVYVGKYDEKGEILKSNQ